jgi:hypothetical protein
VFLRSGDKVLVFLIFWIIRVSGFTGSDEAELTEFLLALNENSVNGSS